MTSPARLTSHEVARQSGADPELVSELIRAAALKPDEHGLHDPGDVPRMRLALALTEGGIAVEDLVHQIEVGNLLFDQVPLMGIIPEATDRSFGEFAESLGPAAAHLPAIYAAFGLALPPPDSVLRKHEEEAVAAFLRVWSLVDDRPEVYQRAARILGHHMRQIVVGSVDLLDEFEGSPPQRLRRGLSIEEAIEPSAQQARTMDALLTWLRERHTEHEVFDRIVAYIHAALERAGRVEPRAQEQPAIAFVDLAGYTERTVSSGDELAARDAARLHELALAAADQHDGRVVKLLGDGVMLRFASAIGAVRGVTSLMAAIGAAELPGAHAGIAAGPLVVRDGDVFGHTVNLASRIAGKAMAGEVLLDANAAARAAAGGIELEDAGEVRLKGLPAPVRLALVRS